jgi:hypothetical protein
MITRLWRGWTTPDNADACQRFLLGELFPSMREIPGFRGRAPRALRAASASLGYGNFHPVTLHGSTRRSIRERLRAHTVKTHARNIYRKLSTSSRADAVAAGRELGLL